MKTIQTFSKTLLSTGVAVAFAMLAAVAANAQSARVSSKPWLPLSKIETQKEFQELSANAQIAMACAKCKSVLVATKRQLATKPGRGTVEELMTVDQCPGCGGKMVVRGDKQTEMVHTCSKCGDDSAFCCATTKDAKPTKGMEKK